METVGRFPGYLRSGDANHRPPPSRASCPTETSKFLDAAEQLAGPYQWGRYDLLLLPPSFPYGGMENP